MLKTEDLTKNYIDRNHFVANKFVIFNNLHRKIMSNIIPIQVIVV